jgi:hypothetical protein
MDGVLAQRQRIGDVPIAHSLRDQSQDFELATRKRTGSLAPISQAVEYLPRTLAKRARSCALEDLEGSGGLAPRQIPSA